MCRHCAMHNPDRAGEVWHVRDKHSEERSTSFKGDFAQVLWFAKRQGRGTWVIWLEDKRCAEVTAEERGRWSMWVTADMAHLTDGEDKYKVPDVGTCVYAEY